MWYCNFCCGTVLHKTCLFEGYSGLGGFSAPRVLAEWGEGMQIIAIYLQSVINVKYIHHLMEYSGPKFGNQKVPGFQIPAEI